MLILEMGIDHPGDMDYLVGIARPTRAVITKLGVAHLEYFASSEELHKEKLKLAQAVREDGWIIYNYDDEALREAVKKLPIRSKGFGYNPEADITAENVSISYAPYGAESAGLSFKLGYEGAVIPVFLPGAIGRPSVYAALAAAGVAATYDLNGLEVAEALRHFSQSAGRLRLIAGIKDSLIIDDSYNASPDSVLEGLAAIKEIPLTQRKRTFIVLGNMKELGQASRAGHEKVGKAAEGDYLVTVGEEAQIISDASYLPTSKKHHFDSSEDAADFLEKEIQEGDLFFIKGSQAARMEKIVKRLMLKKELAKDLLVRQDWQWENK